MTYSDNPYGPKRSRALRRSHHNSVIAGVCGGIAERYGWSPILLRILTLVAFFTVIGSPVVFIYLAIWLLTPVDRPIYVSERERFDRYRS